MNHLANADGRMPIASGTEQPTQNKSVENLVAEFGMLRSAVIRLVEGSPSQSAKVEAKYGCVADGDNHNMSIEEKANAPEVLQRVIWIQTLTLIWMSVETVVSLGAAWIARSPALLAFGGDSAVELLSAAVVFRRFHRPSRGGLAEERAGRIAGGLLFVLEPLLLLLQF